MPAESSPSLEDPNQEWLNLIHDYISRKHPDVSADDVTQDTIEKAVRCGRILDRSQSTTEWLECTADELAHADRRARQAERDSLQRAHVPDDSAGADEPVLAEADRRQLHRSWHMLEASDRELLAALTFCGLTMRQMAAKLGIGYDAVRKRKQRAIAKLRRYFKGLGLVIAAGFAIKDVVRRVSASQAVANTASMVTLVTAGVIGGVISMPSPTDPGGDHEFPLREAQPVVRAVNEPDDGFRHPRPPARPLPRSVVESPAALTTSPLRGNPALVPDDSHERPDLYANLDTDEGPKERHLVPVDTPLGRVVIKGHRYATTPAKAAVVCEQTMAACPSGPSGTSVRSP